MLVIRFHKWAILVGILVANLLVGVSSGDDCGCGGFDTSPPDYGWESPGFGGLDNQDNSNNGLSIDSVDGGAAGSESTQTNSNSAPDSGSPAGSDTGGPGSTSGSESNSGNALSLAIQGEDLYRKGDMNQSLATLNKSLSLDPYSSHTWMTQGNVLLAMGYYEDAIRAYTRVLSLDPSDELAAARRGDALMNTGKFNEAIESYNRAIAMNPNLQDVRDNLTLAKDLAGRVRPDGTMTSGLPSPGPDKTTEGPVTPVSIVPSRVTTLPQSTIPGTTKAPLSPVLFAVTLIIAGTISVIRRKG